jgi:hypothetical protein
MSRLKAQVVEEGLAVEMIHLMTERAKPFSLTLISLPLRSTPFSTTILGQTAAAENREHSSSLRPNCSPLETIIVGLTIVSNWSRLSPEDRSVTRIRLTSHLVCSEAHPGAWYMVSIMSLTS